MVGTEKQFDVFISYSSKDERQADRVKDCLTEVGLRCWIATENIPPGGVWPEQIVEGIHASRSMLVLCSKNSMASIQVLREVEAASKAGIAVIPIRLDDAPLASGFEYFLSTRHWLDATRQPLSTLAQRVVVLLRPLAGALPVAGADAPLSERLPSPRRPYRSWIVISLAAFAVVAALAGAYTLIRPHHNGKQDAVLPENEKTTNQERQSETAPAIAPAPSSRPAPLDLATAWAEATTSVQNGRWEEAAGQFREIARRFPDEKGSDAWNMVGVIYQQKMSPPRLDLAIDAYSKCVDADKSNYVGWCHLMQCLVDNGRPQECVDAFAATVAAARTQPPFEAYLFRGQAYLKLNQYRDAEADLSHALEFAAAEPSRFPSDKQQWAKDSLEVARGHLEKR